LGSVRLWQDNLAWLMKNNPTCGTNNGLNNNLLPLQQQKQLPNFDNIRGDFCLIRCVLEQRYFECRNGFETVNKVGFDRANYLKDLLCNNKLSIWSILHGTKTTVTERITKHFYLYMDDLFNYTIFQFHFILNHTFRKRMLNVLISQSFH
jgi:hypothetical protein